MAFNTNQAIVAEYYVAALGRLPEQGGFDYWVGQLDNGMTPEALMNQFLDRDFPEVAARYPAGQTNEEFISSVYTSTFGRTADASGLAFWTTKLDTMTQTEVLAEMLAIAKDPANSVDAAYLAAQKTLAEDALDTVVVTPGVEGKEFNLTSGTDRNDENSTGTEDDDTFNAYIEQNAFAGGISNSLSSADHLDGNGGTDSLYAELVQEFTGVTAGNNNDVAPHTTDIENITFNNIDDDTTVTVDAEHMYGVEKIGSFYSDGDLVIENLNTLADNGETIRSTSDMTITMDHTDNMNTDQDASDLTVYFDEDYLNTTTQAGGSTLTLKISNVLNMENNENPVEGFDTVNFTVGTTAVAVNVSAATSYEDVKDAINAKLAELNLDDVTATLGTSENAGWSQTTTIDGTTYNFGDVAGQLSPIIITNTGDGLLVKGEVTVAEGGDEGDINKSWQDSVNNDTTNPISINVELEKVGQDAEGGNLVIGGKSNDNFGDSEKDQKDGIEIFNITVNGDDDQPSNLGTISSTNQSLTTVNVANGSEWAGADLTVRNVLGQGQELTLIDSTSYSGDFSLAVANTAVTQQAITSNFGSGNDSYDWMSSEANIVDSGKTYSINMNSGDDTVTADLDGDSVDAQGESFTLNTGAGDDTATVTENGLGGVSKTTTLALDNVNVNLDSGEDTLYLNTNIITKVNAGSASDFVVVDADDATGGASTGTAAVAQIVEIDLGTAAGVNTDGTMVAGDVLTINVDGNVMTYTVTAADVAADNNILATNVTAAINANTAISSVVTAAVTNVGGPNVFEITLTADNAGTSFTALVADNSTENISVSTLTPNTALVSATAGNGTTGTWTIGDGSDATGNDWADSVLYKATVTVDFAGFTSTVLVDTTSANNFVATQADINAAVIKAIADTSGTNNGSELSRLLNTDIGQGSNSSQLLVITSTVQGINDLTINVNQPVITTVATATAADTTINTGDFTSLSTGIVSTTAALSSAFSASPTEAELIATINGVITGNRDETGAVDAPGNNFVLDSNDGTDGSVNTSVTSNAIIDMSTGLNDLVVLDSDTSSADTLVFSATWDKVSVVNFFDAQSNDDTLATAPNDTVIDHDTTDESIGNHMIDFTAWLDDQTSVSGSTGSAVDVATVSDIITATGDLNLASNEVVIVNDFAQDISGVLNETFAAMTASDIDTALEGAANVYGNFANAGSTAVVAGPTNLEGNVISSILMVENDLNQGEYKVFNVETDSTQAAGSEFTVALLGTIDFGESYNQDDAGTAATSFIA